MFDSKINIAQGLINDSESHVDGDSINLEKQLCIQVNEILSLINNNIKAFI